IRRIEVERLLDNVLGVQGRDLLRRGFQEGALSVKQIFQRHAIMTLQCNPRLKRSPTPSGIAEIVSDDFPVLHAADSACFSLHTAITKCGLIRACHLAMFFGKVAYESDWTNRRRSAVYSRLCLDFRPHVDRICECRFHINSRALLQHVWPGRVPGYLRI